ncbi:MAG: adenylate cyclase, partial [Bacteroidia bacterium]
MNTDFTYFALVSLMKKSFLLILYFLACFDGLKVYADQGFKIGQNEESIPFDVEKTFKELLARGDYYLATEDSVKYAEHFLKQAYDLALNANYSAGIINSAYKLGVSYLTTSDHANATRYYYVSMKQAESMKDSASLAMAYMGLGLVMYNMNAWPSSIENFESAFDFKPARGQLMGESLVEYLLGLCYYELKKYDKSKRYLNRAMNSAETNNDSMRILEIRLNLNKIEAETNLSEKVLSEYDDLFIEFTKRNEKIGRCYTLEAKARALLMLGKHKEALENATASLDLARKLDMLYPLHYILDVVIASEYANGNYKEASDYMMELQKLQDSLQNENSATQVALQSAGYEFDKKEANFSLEIAKKNRQRIMLFFLVIALIIIVLAIFFSLRGVAKQRKISDELLLNILPAETARELKINGTASAKSHNEVTIVFADVVNFTNIASNLEPQVIVRMLDHYFGKFDSVMKDFGLEKIKTIGDAYMFVAGLTPGKRNSALLAVDASILILEAIHDLEAEMESRFRQHFNFRFGMHTGQVV